MRLQTSATQVDFFPISTGKRFVQRTTWHPGAESEMITYCTVVKSEMIDLQDDDSCCDHLEFKQLEINDDV